jgi:hypothetical protein
LETAIAAGYQSARLVTDLAFIIAIIDGPPAGELVLGGICTGQSIDWIGVSKLAAQIESVDLITQGFALGMDQSAIWSRLGTFALRFLDDDELAEILYRAAAKIGPHDAIALTNLARHLIRKGDQNSLVEAERLLSKARNFADRRFFWWRKVLTLLREKKGLPPGGKLKATAERKADRSIAEIRLAFQQLETNQDAQQRGFELEKLVFDLCMLTLGIAAPPYRIARDSGVIRQIDGYFSAASDRYRMECKWRSEPIGQNEIVLFSNKLDVAGISGLFISMSGFKETAIAQARELRAQHAILLMNGDETRAVFNGHLPFDELLRLKRQHFDQLSDPYHQVIPTGEIS